MLTVDLKTLQKLLPFYWKEKTPLYLWGKPSSGKTSIVRQFAQSKAKELGLKYSEDEFGDDIFTLKIITMSQYDAPDLRGMPQIRDKGFYAVTQFIATEELPRVGQGIIFFDEMNLADETVRAAMYRYILEGRISNVPELVDERGLPKFWRVAASNTEKDYSGVQQTYLAQTSRFAHLGVEPELDEILQYFLERDHDPRVIGYLKNYPSDLFPAVWDERLLDKKANPFPRQWENVSRLIKGIRDPETLTLLASSCIGPELGSKFGSYVKLSQSVKLEDVLKDPEKTLKKIEERREDRASMFWSIVSSLASLWWKKDNRLPPEKVLKISSCLPPEFSVGFLTLILKKRLNTLRKVEGFDKTMADLGVYFNDEDLA